jgi:hypothetical protein
MQIYLEEPPKFHLISSLIETGHPYLLRELASDAVGGGHLHNH